MTVLSDRYLFLTLSSLPLLRLLPVFHTLGWLAIDWKKVIQSKAVFQQNCYFTTFGLFSQQNGGFVVVFLQKRSVENGISFDSGSDFVISYAVSAYSTIVLIRGANHAILITAGIFDSRSETAYCIVKARIYLAYR